MYQLQGFKLYSQETLEEGGRLIRKEIVFLEIQFRKVSVGDQWRFDLKGEA